VPKKPVQVLRNFLSRASAASHAGPVFVDFGLLQGKIAQPTILWRSLARLVSEFQGATIPMVSPNAPAPALATAASIVTVLGRGCGLRLTAPDIEHGAVNANIRHALRCLGVSPTAVDLFIDLGTTSASYTHNHLRARVPLLADWRTVTILGGVFPPDLTNYASTQQVWYEDRVGWTHYEREALAATGGVRVPTFGDFTTQHAVYSDSPAYAGSVSLRYTLDDRWLILRGEKPNMLKNGGFAQMYGHTALLRQRSDFYGPTFSWGDQMIAQHIPPAPKGNAGTWLAVGICHHMTVVVNQVQAMHARGHAPSASQLVSQRTSVAT
jgi:hypothetical protein